MKRKVSWMLLSFLMVVALVLGSCVEEVPREQEEEEKEEVPAVDEPQYGGRLTYLVYPVWGGEAGNPDPANMTWPGGVFSGPVLERFRKGDLEKYGVRGTGEWLFNLDKQNPLKYSRGAFVESWEVTADKIVFHVRPGVYWAAMGKEHVMETREYTAHDFVFNVNRLLDPKSTSGVTLRDVDFIESVYAVDNYTVVVETKFFYPEWWWLLSGYDGQHIPPEVVEAGASDWNNIVGTGPFYIKEYNPGVSMTYARNPLYYDTTTINGKVYDIPFVDELVVPMIPDFSTVIAALRTGKLDVYFYTQPPDVESLAQTTPELLSAPTMGGWTSIIALRTDRPPLDNVNVRRALMIGTDLEAVHRATHVLGPTYSWPLLEGIPGHVPLAELPPDVRELFDYDPEKARQMLAEAGYPDGFTLEFHAYTTIEHPRDEIGPMVAGMWEANLNIKTIFKPVESVAYWSMLKDIPRHYAKAHKPVLMPLDILYDAFSTKAIGGGNWARYQNPVFDELLAKARVTVDDAERAAILEELFVMALSDVPYIPFGGTVFNAHWWPWVKNFYAEYGGIGWNPQLDRLWIDQSLKAQMGY